MNVGSSGSDRSIVTISTNAVMAKLLVGTTKGGAGAVIQNGGNLRIGPSIISTDVLSVGSGGGYGYYRMNSGSLMTGQFGITGGGAGNNDGVIDVFDGQNARQLIADQRAIFNVDTSGLFNAIDEHPQHTTARALFHVDQLVSEAAYRLIEKFVQIHIYK
jgi:hypothetical protein